MFLFSVFDSVWDVVEHKWLDTYPPERIEAGWMEILRDCLRVILGAVRESAR